MRSRLENTRGAYDLGNAYWRYGVERHWLEGMIQYWREEFDWRKSERKINRLQHFKVTIDAVPLHFVHMRGKGPDPTPLLLLHGWPWTFMDFHEMISPLTDSAAHGGDPTDAFDLIIPSLPGFGFSMPLTRTGLDVPRTGELMSKLMIDVLGYSRFAVAGGDFGAVLTGQIAHAYPEHVIGMLATIPLFPGLDLNDIRPEHYARDEEWMIERKAESARTIVSHVAVNVNDPQSLAYGLVDSPVGTAAWIWERRRAWSDCSGDLLLLHDRDFLCTLASIYWLTRSIGTSLRAYWEHFASGMPIEPLHHRKPVIEVPTAYSIHPMDVMLIPRSIAAANTNLQRWTLMPRGGHFGFSEYPEAMTHEIRTFFSAYRAGTKRTE
jgi:pimeloyl-ACP methyl ester carboxylesterase